MRMIKVKECQVYGCSNRTNQGDFVGSLCAPCYETVISKNILRHWNSQVYRNFIKSLNTKKGKILMEEIKNGN